MSLIFKKIARYFLQGLLVFAPVVLTVYCMVALIRWMDNLVEGWFVNVFPGFGTILILLGITILGVFSSLFFVRPVIHFFDRLLLRTPIVKIFYTAFKDLFSAFVSEEKKFDKPVLVRLTDDGPQRIGFLTDENLAPLGLGADKVTVYIPFGYTISGNLYILPRRNVQILNNISSTDAMKYIISGGVTELGRKDD